MASAAAGVLRSSGAGVLRSAGDVWRGAVRRGSSRVTVAAAAARTALTDMASTIAATNVPVEGAVPRAP
jgi:hypothetical protein